MVAWGPFLNIMTDTTENITFPQLRRRAVKNTFCHFTIHNFLFVIWLLLTSHIDISAKCDLLNERFTLATYIFPLRLNFVSEVLFSIHVQLSTYTLLLSYSEPWISTDFCNTFLNNNISYLITCGSLIGIL